MKRMVVSAVAVGAAISIALDFLSERAGEHVSDALIWLQMPGAYASAALLWGGHGSGVSFHTLMVLLNALVYTVVILAVAATVKTLFEA